MIETLTIIIVVLAIGALIILVHGLKDPKPVSQPQPRAGYKHSALERRRKSLELATKEWNRKLSRGHIFLAGEQKHLVDQLEREVAELEDELFGAAEEAAPKLEAPKRKPVIQVDCIGRGVSGDYYIITCTLCGWESSSFSLEEVDAKIDAHEMEHA